MTSFTDAVAQAAAISAADASAALVELGIETTQQPGSPSSLQLTRLAFTGEKTLPGEPPTPIDFNWDFELGLTAVSSEANLVGKSSILWLIRWGLVGAKPSDLTPEVLGWINEVTLEGDVAGSRLVVRWSVDAGSVSGTAEYRGHTSPFAGDAAFQEAMDAIMLPALNLRQMPGWRKLPGGEGDAGNYVKFGWATQFHALMVRGDKVGVLLGEHIEDGQANMLLQTFMGLPWAYTHRAASAALKSQQYQRQAANHRIKTGAATAEAVAKPLRSAVEALGAQIAKLDAAGAVISPEEADRRAQTFADANQSMTTAVDRVNNAKRAAAVVLEEADEATKRLRAAQEDTVIVNLIGRVQPHSCPRCSRDIDEARLKAEADQHQCSVCDEPLPVDEAVASATTSATDAADKAAEALASANADVDCEVRAHAAASAALDSARTAMAEVASAAPRSAERRALELKLAVAQGRLEQAAAAVEPQEAHKSVNELVAAAAVRESERRRGEAAEQMLERLGTEITLVAGAFGFKNLQSVRLKLNAHLELTAADAVSQFGQRTPGEKLRLKIALVVALLRVSSQLGIGRHPGLLLIDSPGGEEMVELNVASVLTELQRLCTDLPELQIVVATAHAADVREVVPEERTIHGPTWREVW